jgi:alkanesulfonate monooxygenase SsuD/methylene tetrahydromethanopterin reductase-like flavin-dependent oxidoreductase (luciferase family)
VFEAFSVAAGEKRKLFQANLEIMLAAWRGEPVLDRGEGDPVLLAPLPIQRPHPPVWVAAFGPLALKQVASLGLPYLASPIESLAVLEDNYNSYHAALQGAGHAPVATIPVMRTVFVTSSVKQAAAVRLQLEQSVPPKIRKPGVGVEDWGIVGDSAYCRDKLWEYVERLNISHLILRGGIRGVPEAEQLRSHESLLAVVSGL